MTIEQLMAEYREKLAAARALLDRTKAEKRDLTAEEEAQWDKLYDEAQTAKKKADQLHAQQQRAAEREERLRAAEDEIVRNHGINLDRSRGSVAGDLANGAGRGAMPSDQTFNLALHGWFAAQMEGGEVTEEQREACRACGFSPENRNLQIALPTDVNAVRAQVLAARMQPAAYQQLVNALGTQPGSSGGVLVPSGFVMRLETALLAFGEMLQFVETIRTSTGEPLPWPIADDTGNTGRQIGEAKAVNSDDDPAFAARILHAYGFTSDEIKVAFQLLRDSAFDLAGWLADALGMRLGRIFNRKATIGTGAATPEGIMVRATVGKTTASATAIADTELLDLQHAVDPAYRNAPGVAWMAHDNVWKALRKLKDGNSRFHWQDGMQAGQPSLLFTKPTITNQDMADSIATGNKTLLYGRIPAYKWRQVNRIRMYRLMERHRENDQDAFLAFAEADGKLVDAADRSVKVLQQL